jgi:hypothetical protein
MSNHRRAQQDLLEFLKDARAVSITQKCYVDAIVVWRVGYVIDPDMEFTTLDEQEREIKSRCQIRAVECTVDADGRRTVEVEWI